MHGIVGKCRLLSSTLLQMCVRTCLLTQFKDTHAGKRRKDVFGDFESMVSDPKEGRVHGGDPAASPGTS